jgi:hypothetical protein
MALVSPGVEVSIIDQSQYLPAASSSVPLIVIATAQNKANAAGTGVAAATTASNANKLYQITSQRDLVNLFGTPFFYKTSNGTSIQGYELNEYGLLATYSLLGATNRCFVVRADIDLGSLVGTLSRPLGNPADGTYWLDTSSSTWGIYEFNAATGKFTNKIPLVITEAAQIVENLPAASLGTIGSYAIIPTEITTTPLSRGTMFYKNYTNSWVVLGSSEWKLSVPTVEGTISSLSEGAFGGNWSFDININSEFFVTINVTASTSMAAVVDQINALNIGQLVTRLSSGKLILSYGNPATNSYISLSNGTGTALQSMGITPGTYFTPDTTFGTSAQMPLWSATQPSPHPTGSVWVKTSITGNGMNLILNQYAELTDSWDGVTVNKYTSSVTALGTLDSTGGKSIPLGTVFAQSGSPAYSGIVMYGRKATGSTIITGDIANPEITSGRSLIVRVSVPGQTSVPAGYYTVVTSGTDATSFVANWLSTNIPYTNALVNSDGAIELEHTEGGDIYMTDGSVTTGISNGLLDEIGFSATNADVISNTFISFELTGVAQTSTTRGPVPGLGIGATFDVLNDKGVYSSVTLNGPGTLYAAGDLIVISGTNLAGNSPQNDLTLTVQSVNGVTGAIQTFSILSGTPKISYFSCLSNWEVLSYTPNEGALATNPINGTNWFYSTATEVDIMVNRNGAWRAYSAISYDTNGSPSYNIPGGTNPTGPIIATSAPVKQTDGTQLVYGDLWLDSSDLENYPKLSRWQQVGGSDEWVSIDNTDQTSEDGILFADARWATSGSVDPVNDPLSSIESLLISDYLDLDAPNPDLYPQGMLLFNTRRSGYNVKQFKTNYFTGNIYPDQNLPTYSYTWVTASGLKTDGMANMGRKAQRAMVVQAMKAAIGTNQEVREEDTFFNLIAAPNYPELQPDMITLNNDRNNTAYIIGDTPLRLADQATALTNWANNTVGASTTGEDGLVSRDEYLGIFYPSGITTDLTGAQVVVPSSHMMLRTFLRNDTVAYPWFAPAGTRRGTIDNATNIGYLNASTGEFVSIKNRMSIRDVLYTNQINPLAFFTGVGLLNYGNKNSKDTQSAMDRINVARLVCYIRERLQVAARPFVFEPNDSITRNQLTGVVQTLFIDLVAKRGLYDYLVVCDESNNTPARIDRSELWIDVAIEPVKAAEFIYIPVRVLNTGEIAGS